GVVQMDDELGGTIAHSGGWIDRVHPEPDRLAPLELIVQQTVARVTRRVEVDDVAEEDQVTAAPLPRKTRRGQQRHQDERRASAKAFHADKVTEPAPSVQR